MRGVFDDLVFLMGTGVLGDQALFCVAPHDKLTEGATFLARCFV